MSAPGRSKRELRPLGGQRSGESRKRGGRSMCGAVAARRVEKRW
jgi:hypothetical protein